MTANRLVSLLIHDGLTVATAESLTGGLVCAALTSVPGSSAVVRGGVIAYATQVKASVLGVGEGLLAARGAVDPEVAMAMADGVAELLGADVGLSTTGVAGPAASEGKPVGTVFVAVGGPGMAQVPPSERCLGLHLTGEREQIRAASALACLGLAHGLVAARRAADRA